jgi:hypothetical protein
MRVIRVGVVLVVLVVAALHLIFVNLLVAPVGRVLLEQVAALLETPDLRVMQVQLQQVYVKHFRADRLGMAVMVVRRGLPEIMEMLAVMDPA